MLLMFAQDTQVPVLETIFRWSLDASTQIAVVVFLMVGVASTIWGLVIRPLLITFSQKYQRHIEKQSIREIRPTLVALGLQEERAVIRDVRRLRGFLSKQTDDVHKERLLRIMREHFVPQRVMLGKRHSDPNEGFVDLRAAAMDAKQREVLADILANRVAQELRRRISEDASYIGVQRIIGMKEGNPLVAALVAQKLGIPLALYRGTDFPRFHGSSDPADAFDGHIEQGDKVILVDDTTFRGTTLMEAAQRILSLKANVTDVFLLFEPEKQQARRSLEIQNIGLHSVLFLDKATKSLLR